MSGSNVTPITPLPRLLVSPADRQAGATISESADSIIGVDPDRGKVVWLMDPDLVGYIGDVLEDEGLDEHVADLRAASLAAVADVAALERRL